MYASVREYTLRAGKLDETVEKIRTEFVPLLDKAPGFLGYTVVHTGGDQIVTASVFETQSGAEGSVKAAADWVKANLAASVTAPPRVTTGEMPVRHVKAGGQARYGVLRRFEFKAGNLEKMTGLIRDGLVPLLAEMPGFASYGTLIEPSRDHGMSLAAYADRALAEAAFAKASNWIEANMGEFAPKLVDTKMGEIKVRHMALARSH